ncbi:hypothetical protein [Pelagibaculum spongiae]|uniref:hypothetical protein n=1 Tax=Pelagibaculum spongiae TaxID=2080658 RepID=UPI001057F7B4|nr:hypothetical protein [Pelagibaculum spongiae]
MFFISAGDYPEIKTKTILKMFFARSESSQHLIDNAGYFERNDLLPFANIDYDKTPEAERITAMAEAKAMMMQLQSGEFASANSGQSISPLNVILIDDEPANRQAVLKKYFQVINPCAASYTARLQTLQSLIPSGMHRFIKDDQDRPRKTLSELMQSLEI